jgi:hypothetical protein
MISTRFGTVPTSIVTPFRGPRETLKMMADHALGEYGERSIIVRKFAEFIVGEIRPKAYDSEILAIRNCLVQPSPWRPGVPLLKYLNDPVHLELLRTPERMVRDIMEIGYCACDCDESACLAATLCLLTGRECALVAMGFSPGSLSHVAVRVKEPKSGQWILLDGVAGPREREAAGKAKEILIWPVD